MSATPTVTARIEGALLVVRCPYCHSEHVHGRGTGHVTADCHADGSTAGYIVIDPADTCRTAA